MTHADFFSELALGIAEADVRGKHGSMPMTSALTALKAMMKTVHDLGCKVIFIGNGGSGAIASHMAIDYTKNGGIRAIALNDHPTLTCIANDFGYAQVFAKQIEFYASPQDLVVVVSTSGTSENVLQAATIAKEKGCVVATFSGMLPDNKLRRMGDFNFYVPSGDYGIVEIAHLTLLHSMVSA